MYCIIIVYVCVCTDGNEQQRSVADVVQPVGRDGRRLSLAAEVGPRALARALPLPCARSRPRARARARSRSGPAPQARGRRREDAAHARTQSAGMLPTCTLHWNGVPYRTLPF